MTSETIKKALPILKAQPIEEFYVPHDIGVCIAQRVRADEVSCAMYLLSDNDGEKDMYCYGVGHMYLQIGRKSGTPWHKESGHTYMCWGK